MEDEKNIAAFQAISHFGDEVIAESVGEMYPRSSGLKCYVKHIPFVTTALLEGANLSQLHRMWTERTSAGQSIAGWSLVWLALVLWLIYYTVMLPNEKAPKWCTALGIIINSTVIFSVIYFRYLV